MQGSSRARLSLTDWPLALRAPVWEMSSTLVLLPRKGSRELLLWGEGIWPFICFGQKWQWAHMGQAVGHTCEPDHLLRNWLVVQHRRLAALGHAQAVRMAVPQHLHTNQSILVKLGRPTSNTVASSRQCAVSDNGAPASQGVRVRAAERWYKPLSVIRSVCSTIHWQAAVAAAAAAAEEGAAVQHHARVAVIAGRRKVVVRERLRPARGPQLKQWRQLPRSRALCGCVQPWQSGALSHDNARAMSIALSA